MHRSVSLIALPNLPEPTNTLSSGPFSPSNLDQKPQITDHIKIEPIIKPILTIKTESSWDFETFSSDNKEIDYDIEMDSKAVLEACRGEGIKGEISNSILSDHGPPPSPPEAPINKLNHQQLLPPTPSVYLDNKKHAFSPQLQEFCLKHPIAVIRGLASALKLG